MIRFNVPLRLGTEKDHVLSAQLKSIALDMAASLCESTAGEEVILPTYTFPTTVFSRAKEDIKLVL